ncbi:nuclease-related domain-containing protein [Piscibacillus salipiscarius]|nr:nuclease-related domain-containing protein [Piscibacillus salipiscarius]
MLPIKLLRTIAYLRNLESSHPTYSNLNQDFKRSVAGMQGEKSISYYLYPIIEKDYRVFYNVRLFINGQYFEIDVLLISRNFILIIEVKNLKGRIMFDHKSGGMIQSKDGDFQTYQDPVLQISRQEALLSNWLKERGIHIPVKSVACFVNRHVILEPGEHTDSRIIYGYKLPLVYERFQSEFKSHPQAISENFLYNILIRENQPLDIKLMNKYGLTKQDFKPGLSCIHCSKKG